MTKNELGETIKKLRLEKAWPQSQLADIAGCSLRTIQRLERKSRCSHETLMAVASAFDKDVTDFTDQWNPKGSQDEQGILSNRSKPRLAAILGCIAMFPTFYFDLAAILKLMGVPYLADLLMSLMDHPLLHTIIYAAKPILFIGGVLFAVILNLSSITTLQFEKMDASCIQSRLILKLNISNLLIAGFSVLLLLVLFAFAIEEHFVFRG